MIDRPTGVAGAATFLATWGATTAAMMLPGTVPILRLHGLLARSHLRTFAFGLGYVAVWTAAGAFPYAAAVVTGGVGRSIAAAAFAAAAAYQLSPLKRRCLERCRSPLAELTSSWREGRAGSLAMGARHGIVCGGCCAGLMVVLFVLGLMSMLWMAVVALAILGEKVGPHGLVLSRSLAGVFAAVAVAVSLDASVLEWLR